MSRRSALALLILLSLASASHALTIVEGTDFSNSSASPTAIGTLDLGENTVSGSIDSTTLAGDFADAWSFAVDPGMLVSSVMVSISDYSAAGNPNGIARDPLAANISDFAVTGNGLSPELLLVPFGNGSFVFELADTTGAGLLDNLAFSYMVTLTAVPEPSTALLLGAALAALGARRRSRR